MASFNDFIQRAAGRANRRVSAGKTIDIYNGNSIKKMTKDMILQFPILVSQNISQDTVATLAAGFEVENTIMLRLLLQNDFGTLTNGSGDLISSLRKIHTNIEGNPTFLESLKESNKSLSIPLEEKFCMWSLNESTLPKYLNEDSHSEVDNDARNNRNIDLGPLSVKDNLHRQNKTTTDVKFIDNAPFNPDMFKKVNDLQPTFVKIKISVSNSTTTEREGGFGVKLGKFGMSKEGSPLSVGSDLNVGYGNTKNISRTSLDEKEIIFGVKCMAHPLKSEDIIFNIGNEFKNSTLFKFVKWTTGEYGFFKGLGEIVFDFTNMKNTGIQAAKTSNYWWYKLRKMKNENKQIFHSSTSNKNAPIKTSTLVITKDEVDYIATTYRIDLSMPKFAQKLMNSLYLLNFAYIDESTETVYLYDEPSASYTVKKFNDFKKQKKATPINIDDIKSLFGR
jgi:hypothetical protein